jgi:hypothetical protein
LEKVDRFALLAVAEGEGTGTQDVNRSRRVTSGKSREVEFVANSVSYTVEGVIMLAQGVESESEWDSKLLRTKAPYGLQIILSSESKLNFWTNTPYHRRSLQPRIALSCLQPRVATATKVEEHQRL